MNSDTVIIRTFPGYQDYESCWKAMQAFTQQRDENSLDELWILEHQPVFTQGQNGKPEHLLNPDIIPVVQTDRGGQITYHGPGQLVIYTLVDVKRKKLNVRELVTCLEQAIISFLKSYNIDANARCDAPGVYINNKKICSVGLRIKRGCSYHGLAFNVDMDLLPFTYINPCGYTALEMTQLKDHLQIAKTVQEVSKELIEHLIKNLGYTTRLFQPINKE